MEKMTRTKQKNSYNTSHYKRVSLNVAFHDFEIWKEFAEQSNQPMNTMIKNAVKYYIESSRRG